MSSARTRTLLVRFDRARSGSEDHVTLAGRPSTHGHSSTRQALRTKRLSLRVFRAVSEHQEEEGTPSAAPRKDHGSTQESTYASRMAPSCSVARVCARCGGTVRLWVPDDREGLGIGGRPFKGPSEATRRCFCQNPCHKTERAVASAGVQVVRRPLGETERWSRIGMTLGRDT